MLKKGALLNGSNLRALSLLIILTTIMTGCASQPSTVQIPTIEDISPQSVKAGQPTFKLTVIGNHFTDNSTILWNGMALRTAAISGSELQATVPAANIAIAGTALINVRLPESRKPSCIDRKYNEARVPENADAADCFSTRTILFVRRVRCKIF